MTTEQEILKAEMTYRVVDMNLDEVEKLGRYRWRRSRVRSRWSRVEAFIFPGALFYFVVIFLIPTLPSGTKTALLSPLVPALGWLVWSTVRDMKAANGAARQFVNSPSVRKNGK